MSTLSLAVSRLGLQPHVALAQLPGEVAASRSLSEARMASLTLVNSFCKPGDPVVKLHAAQTLRQLPADIETLKLLCAILEKSADAEVICVVLAAIHSDSAPNTAELRDLLLLVQHQLLKMIDNEDERIAQQAILTFGRLYRRESPAAIAPVDHVSAVLRKEAVSLQTRLLLIQLLKKLYPDERAISLCFEQLDSLSQSSACRPSRRRRIARFAIQSIVDRPELITDETLQSLASRNLITHAMFYLKDISLSSFRYFFYGFLTSDNPRVQQLALLTMARILDSIPHEMLTIVKRLVPFHTTVCLRILSRQLAPQDMVSVLTPLIVDLDFHLKKTVLVHAVRLSKSDSSASLLFHKIVDRLSRTPTKELLIAISQYLHHVISVDDGIASLLFSACDIASCSDIPRRLTARVCLQASSRNITYSDQFCAIAANIISTQQSSFGRYLIGLECLMYGGISGGRLAKPIFSDLNPLSPTFNLFWLRTLMFVSASLESGGNTYAALVPLYQAHMAMSAVSFPGIDTFFQLEFLRLRIELIEATCSIYNPQTKYSTVLQQSLEVIAAGLVKLAHISMSLSTSLTAYLSRLSTLCKDWTQLQVLRKDLLAIPASFFTLLPCDVVGARASVSAGLISVSGQRKRLCSSLHNLTT
uniref:Uncharacterized protein n=1 Tax=Spongospora subterranea TaxID=70186 RepID=A0A0H5QIH6_9EUKA|eukprot:CRZ01447.1 hypothetical protein [Spongospora subterranea]